MSEYDTRTHLFVVKSQHLLGYHWGSGTRQIQIAECWTQRHSSVIPGQAAAFAPGYFPPYAGSPGTTELCNPVLNAVLGFVWSQLGHATTHYGCIMPAQARLKSNEYATDAHVSQCVMHFTLDYAAFSPCFPRLRISGRSAYRLSSIKTLLIQQQAAHATGPLPPYESMLDQDMTATTKVRWTVITVSTCPLEKSRPVQLNCKCTDLAN